MVLNDFDFLLHYVLDALLLERVALSFLALFGVGRKSCSVFPTEVASQYVTDSRRQTLLEFDIGLATNVDVLS